MKGPLFPLALAVLGLYLLFAGPAPSPTPTPAPLPSDAPDLLAVFRSNPDQSAARAHALLAAGLFNGLRDALAIDREAFARGEARLGNAGLVEDHRFLAVRWALRGGSLGTTYPAFGETVGRFLQARVGDENGPTDEAGYERWQDAYRALEASALHAAENL